jgi:hypothetical protein
VHGCRNLPAAIDLPAERSSVVHEYSAPMRWSLHRLDAGDRLPGTKRSGQPSRLNARGRRSARGSSGGAADSRLTYGTWAGGTRAGACPASPWLP